MRYLFKALLSIMLCLTMIFFSVACEVNDGKDTNSETDEINDNYETEDGSESEPNTERNTERRENGNMKSIKILAIGNSFSIDAMEYLWDIFKDAGYDDVKLGNLYIGGCSLDTHWSNIEKNSTSYVYSQNTNGQWRNSSDSINNVLPSEDWDVITIQQVSQESGLPTTYGNFDNIVEYIVKNKPENAKLYWHMTWAYQSDSTHWGFVNYNNDQMTMYNAIVKTVNDVVIKNPDIDGVIPSGTAIQNIRTSYLGDTLTRDGFHMSYDYGRYVTALTWFAYISGEDSSIVRCTPSKYPDLLLDRYVMYDAVNAAVKVPYSVTPSEYPQ